MIPASKEVDSNVHYRFIETLSYDEGYFQVHRRVRNPVEDAASRSYNPLTDYLKEVIGD